MALVTLNVWLDQEVVAEDETGQKQLRFLGLQRVEIGATDLNEGAAKVALDYAIRGGSLFEKIQELVDEARH